VSIPDGLSAVAASAPSVYIANARLVRLHAGGEPSLGGVLVEGDSIAAVAETEREQREARARARDVFDAAGLILMPGLVNAHYHSYGTLLKGTQNRLPLEPWALYTVAYGRALGAEAIRLAVLLGAAEMIRNGITTCLDHFPHTRWAESALAAHEASGMRVAFAPFMHDVFDHEFLQLALPPEIRAALDTAPRSSAADAERMYRDRASRWRGHPRVSILLGPNAFQRCSPGLLDVWRRLADDLGLHAHTHLVETRVQAVRGRAVWPGGTVEAMARAGLLSERLSLAHGVWLTPEEGEVLARHGVTVVHNPASNLMLGSGRLALPTMLERGVPLALGTDSSNSGGRHDLFEVMRLALMLPRPDTPDPRAWPEARQVLEMATTGGARAIGQVGKLGRIEPGQRADLVLLDPRGAALAGAPMTVPHLVQHAGATAVAGVMIDGAWALRDGRILTFDEPAVLDEVAAISAEARAAAGPELVLAETAASYFQACG
jgi:5-methylthioadenosine/S-adenosylhomocysteine deaminase